MRTAVKQNATVKQNALAIVRLLLSLDAPVLAHNAALAEERLDTSFRLLAPVGSPPTGG